ncbi:MAG TPA: hypothetical protein VK002_14735 [Rubricoccaceae bacterium]|nr:hypothetical protein [Rubricoccaceae bacterium]
MANPLTRLFLDPAADDRARAARKFQLSGDYRWWAVPLGVGVVLTALAFLGLLADEQRFFYAYLVGWVFCVSIAVGALFFVMIHHITRARWSVSIRRIPELIAANFPLLALLGIPLLFGLHDLYHWTHEDLYDPDGAHFDPILAGKRGYLNVPFFLVRLAAYFLVWSFLGLRLYALSVRQDTEPSVEYTRKMRFWSGVGIPLTGLATAFASYDLVMSLDPHWFSTMFGVYFWAGGWLGALALITFLALLFRKAGYLEHVVTREHYHDMGKYLFGFVVFWAYIAFSQYMLIWYGDLPEETQWFVDRFTHGWQSLSWALLIFHFALPFLILILRTSKRVLPVLAFMCGWLLVMHWIDLFWQAMPTIMAEAGHTAMAQAAHGAEAAGAAAGTGHAVAYPIFDTAELADVSSSAQARFAWADFAAWLGLFGVFVGATLWRAGRHSLTPYNDPYFADSVRFENY